MLSHTFNVPLFPKTAFKREHRDIAKLVLEFLCGETGSTETRRAKYRPWLDRQLEWAAGKGHADLVSLLLEFGE